MVQDEIPRHSERVKAWVWRIINPLVESLKRELHLLNEGNLSWRSYSGKCEYIRPHAEYIIPAQLPNYDDFVSSPHNEAIVQALQAHDAAVALLESAARRFFEGLLHSALFNKQVSESLREYSITASSDPVYPPAQSINDLSKYIAEYLINGVDLLPSHYTTYKFWADYKSRFDQTREEFSPYEQRESYRALVAAAENLKGASEEMLAALQQHRQKLCRDYDISFAPLESQLASNEFTFG